MNERISQSPNPTEAHPDWCVRHLCFAGLENAAGHATGAIDQGEASAEVAQYVEWVDDVVLESEPGVLCYFKGNEAAEGRRMTARECRDLAAVLLGAADALDAIEKGALR